jgi:hypothetical protein
MVCSDYSKAPVVLICVHVGALRILGCRGIVTAPLKVEAASRGVGLQSPPTSVECSANGRFRVIDQCDGVAARAPFCTELTVVEVVRSLENLFSRNLFEDWPGPWECVSIVRRRTPCRNFFEAGRRTCLGAALSFRKDRRLAPPSRGIGLEAVFRNGNRFLARHD